MENEKKETNSELVEVFDSLPAEDRAAIMRLAKCLLFCDSVSVKYGSSKESALMA